MLRWCSPVLHLGMANNTTVEFSLLTLAQATNLATRIEIEDGQTLAAGWYFQVFDNGKTDLPMYGPFDTIVAAAQAASTLL